MAESERQKQHKQRIDELLAEYEEQATVYSRQLTNALDDTYDDILVRIHRLPEEALTTFNRNAIKDELRDALTAFEVGFLALMASAVPFFGNAGVDVVRKPFKELLDFDIEPAMFTAIPMDTIVQNTVELTTSLMKSATFEVQDELIRKIAVNVFQGGSPAEIVGQIEKALIGQIGGQNAGVVNLNDKAWSIYRTESMKVFNLGTELQMFEAREKFPKLQKVWQHSGMTGFGSHPRPGHVALDGVKIGAEESWMNPVTGMFLKHPHDPGAPASECVHCMCIHLPAMPDETDLETKTMVLT